MGGSLSGHFLSSAWRVLLSLAAALVTAVPLGILMGRMEKADALLSPVVYLVYPIPKIVLLPVIYVLFGITNISKILLIALILFFTLHYFLQFFDLLILFF